MNDDGDKRISIMLLGVFGLIALVGCLVLLYAGRGETPGFTGLFGVVTGVVGALTMYVRQGS